MQPLQFNSIIDIPSEDPKVIIVKHINGQCFLGIFSKGKFARMTTIYYGVIPEEGEETITYKSTVDNKIIEWIDIDKWLSWSPAARPKDISIPLP